MSEEQKKTRKENSTQRDAFLVYFNLGGERSLERVAQTYANAVPKRVISLSTLKSWCKKYQWVERVQAMDEEVSGKAEQIAIKEATAKKSDILKAVKNTMIQFNRAILDGTIIPSASDFKKMWEVARIELGKSIGQDAISVRAPAINIFLTKNEKVIKVVQQSQEELRKVLEGEIKEND